MISRGAFLIILFGLGGIDFCIPFFLLKDIPSFLGNYLFWCLLTLVMLVFGVVHTSNWDKWEGEL